MAEVDPTFTARRAPKKSVADIGEVRLSPLRLGSTFVDQTIKRLGDIIECRSPGILFLEDPLKTSRNAGIDKSFKGL